MEIRKNYLIEIKKIHRYIFIYFVTKFRLQIQLLFNVIVNSMVPEIVYFIIQDFKYINKVS